MCLDKWRSLDELIYKDWFSPAYREHSLLWASLLPEGVRDCVRRATKPLLHSKTKLHECSGALCGWKKLDALWVGKLVEMFHSFYRGFIKSTSSSCYPFCLQVPNHLSSALDDPRLTQYVARATKHTWPYSQIPTQDSTFSCWFPVPTLDLLVC